MLRPQEQAAGRKQQSRQKKTARKKGLRKSLRRGRFPGTLYFPYQTRRAAAHRLRRRMRGSGRPVRMFRNHLGAKRCLHRRYRLMIQRALLIPQRPQKIRRLSAGMTPHHRIQREKERQAMPEEEAKDPRAIRMHPE